MPKPKRQPEPPLSRAAILSDIEAALRRDVKPALPAYNPAVEMTISDIVSTLNRDRPADVAPWNRVSVEREMKRLKVLGKWTRREVLVEGRKATAWREVGPG